MLSFIPLPYRILGAVLVLAAVFVYGYKKGGDVAEAEIKQQVAKYEKQLLTLEVELEKEKNNIKEKLVVEYVDRINTIKEKQYVYVNQAKDIVPSQYPLSNGWVYLHDHVAGSKGGDADPARVADESASDVKDNQALSVVVDNYGTCKQNAEQLVALQNYIKLVKEAVDKANANPARLKP